MTGDTREFKDKAGERDLGDPATDLPLTLRVHPDDDPMDPHARRVIRDADATVAPWFTVTGHRPQCDDLPAYFLSDDEVADWPYTSMTVAGAAFLPPDPHRTVSIDHEAGTVTCHCGESASVSVSYPAAEWWRKHRRQARNATAQAVERGDMGVEAFKASGR